MNFHKSKIDLFAWYKEENSDLAFFTFHDKKIKTHSVLNLPQNQMVKKIIKMKDHYLILGQTWTKLKWDFTKADGRDWADEGEWEPYKLEMQKDTSLDPFLLLYDESFNYVDSEVYPDRIFSMFSSIEKIDDDHYMLFELNKGSKASVTINKL